MKKIILLCAFMLLTVQACGIMKSTTPPTAIPTFDDNLISTMVVQTAEALALSFTPTQTPLPTATPTETLAPTFTFTSVPTEAPTLTLTPSPTVAVTVTMAKVTHTSTPTLTKTNVPATNTQTALTTTPVPTTALPVGATIVPDNTACYEGNSNFELRVIELINMERANAGLGALSYQPQLNLTAQLHSAEMACNNYFSHTGLNGSTFSERAKRQGYNIGYGGENIAAGYSKPEDVVSGWMNSEGHKANILGEHYMEIGVGYAYNKDSAYGTYWTAVFGSP